MAQAQPGRRPGVLVVDDAPDVLAVLSAMLRMEGCTPHPAAGAGAALGLLAANPGVIDCALIDRNMPGVGGEEACRLLRAAKPGLRCWLMTGEGDVLAPPGFEGVLAKPISRAALRSCLAALGPA
jgi:CheY-like chemotaxis protein